MKIRPSKAYGNGSAYYGNGFGKGYGYGDGFANGLGFGYGIEILVGGIMGNAERFIKTLVDEGKWTGRDALMFPNEEWKRVMIETMGPDIFFSDLDLTVIDEDVDQYGYKRRLVRFPMREIDVGYLQAVHVVCPSTGREYYLNVKPDAKTCQAGVASTFGMRPEQYNPIRES